MANKVEVHIPMPELDEVEMGQAMLDLSTYRPGDGGVGSYAHVTFRKNGFKSMRLFHDFSVRLEENKGLRATQKNIDAQHARIFTAEHIEILKTKALNHYTKKASAAA